MEFALDVGCHRTTALNGSRRSDSRTCKFFSFRHKIDNDHKTEKSQQSQQMRTPTSLGASPHSHETRITHNLVHRRWVHPSSASRPPLQERHGEGLGCTARQYRLPTWFVCCPHTTSQQLKSRLRLHHGQRTQESRRFRGEQTTHLCRQNDQSGTTHFTSEFWAPSRFFFAPCVPRSAVPSRCSGETSVVSIANCDPFYNMSPSATTSKLRPSVEHCQVHVSDEDVVVWWLCPFSRFLPRGNFQMPLSCSSTLLTAMRQGTLSRERVARQSVQLAQCAARHPRTALVKPSTLKENCKEAVTWA